MCFTAINPFVGAWLGRGAVLAIDTFKLPLTTAEVLTLLAANSAILGIAIGVFIVAGTVFHCTGKFFYPHLVEVK